MTWFFVFYPFHVQIVHPIRPQQCRVYGQIFKIGQYGNQIPANQLPKMRAEPLSIYYYYFPTKICEKCVSSSEMKNRHEHIHFVSKPLQRMQFIHTLAHPAATYIVKVQSTDYILIRSVHFDYYHYFVCSWVFVKHHLMTAVCVCMCSVNVIRVFAMAFNFYSLSLFRNAAHKHTSVNKVKMECIRSNCHANKFSMFICAFNTTI